MQQFICLLKEFGRLRL